MAAILKTSPLKTLFDSSQLSGSINVQDGGTTSFLKTIHGSRPKWGGNGMEKGCGSLLDDFF